MGENYLSYFYNKVKTALFGHEGGEAEDRAVDFANLSSMKPGEVQPVSNITLDDYKKTQEVEKPAEDKVLDAISWAPYIGNIAYLGGLARDYAFGSDEEKEDIKNALPLTLALAVVGRGRPKGPMSPESKAKFLARRQATLDAKNGFIGGDKPLFITRALTLGGTEPRGVKPTLEYNTWEEMMRALSANRMQARRDNVAAVASGVQKTIDNQAAHNTAMRVSDGIAMKKAARKESHKLNLEGPTGISLSGEGYYGDLSQLPNISGMTDKYIKRAAIEGGYWPFNYTHFDDALKKLKLVLRSRFSGSDEEIETVINRIFLKDIINLKKFGGKLNYLNIF